MCVHVRVRVRVCAFVCTGITRSPLGAGQVQTSDQQDARAHGRTHSNYGKDMGEKTSNFHVVSHSLGI